MRVVIAGAGALGVALARVLLGRGHEVVLIERSRERIEELSMELDCGFLEGDATTPAILEEAGPGGDVHLFCLTESDQDNILSALMGRSLEFARVIPKLEDPQFEHLCTELGLDDAIIPDRMVARTLADFVAGRDVLELSTMIKGEVRFRSFIVDEEMAGPVEALELPGETRPICLYRQGEAMLVDADAELEAGDEVVLITLERHLDALDERLDETNESNSG